MLSKEEGEKTIGMIPVVKGIQASPITIEIREKLAQMKPGDYIEIDKGLKNKVEPQIRYTNNNTKDGSWLVMYIVRKEDKPVYVVTRVSKETKSKYVRNFEKKTKDGKFVQVSSFDTRSWRETMKK